MQFVKPTITCAVNTCRVGKILVGGIFWIKDKKDNFSKNFVFEVTALA
jgi:hypothetical protein